MGHRPVSRKTEIFLHEYGAEDEIIRAYKWNYIFPLWVWQVTGETRPEGTRLALPFFWPDMPRMSGLFLHEAAPGRRLHGIARMLQLDAAMFSPGNIPVTFCT